jgi:hypothetical protein
VEALPQITAANHSFGYLCGKNIHMFSKGQWLFALSFLIAFVIAAVVVYRKDRALHREHYKGSYRVLLIFLLFVVFLFAMKFVLKR